MIYSEETLTPNFGFFYNTTATYCSRGGVALHAFFPSFQGGVGEAIYQAFKVGKASLLVEVFRQRDETM